MVVEVEFNGTNKTTLRSEWGSVPKKQKKIKKEQKKLKKELDRADAFRDYRLGELVRHFLTPAENWVIVSRTRRAERAILSF